MPPTEKFKYQFVFDHERRKSTEKPSQNIRAQSSSFMKTSSRFENINTAQKFQKREFIQLMPSQSDLQTREKIFHRLQKSEGKGEGFILSKKDLIYRGSLGSVSNSYLPIKNNIQIRYKPSLLTSRKQSLERQSMNSDQKKTYQYYFKKPDLSIDKTTQGNQLQNLSYSSINYQKQKNIHNAPSPSKQLVTNRQIVNGQSQSNRIEKKGHLYFSTCKVQKEIAPKYQQSNQVNHQKSKNNMQLSLDSPRMVIYGLNDDSQLRINNFSLNHSSKVGQLIGRGSSMSEPSSDQIVINNIVSQRWKMNLQPSKSIQSLANIKQSLTKGKQSFIKGSQFLPKGKQITGLFNGPMSTSTVSWCEDNFAKQHQKPNQVSYNKVEPQRNRQEYLAEIEKFRQKLRYEEVKISSLLTKNDNLKGSIQLIDAKRQNRCKDCKKFWQKLAIAEKEVIEVDRKRQLHLDQIHRQQKYIKELQQNENKSRHEIEKKTIELTAYKRRIEVLEKVESQYKQSLQIIKNQHNLQLESQTEKLKHEYELIVKREKQILARQKQLLAKQKENNLAHLICIKQLSERIQQMDQNHAFIMKQLTLKYEGNLQDMRHSYQIEAQNLKKLMKIEQEKQGRQIENLKKQCQILKQQNSEIKKQCQSFKQSTKKTNELLQNLKNQSINLQIQLNSTIKQRDHSIQQTLQLTNKLQLTKIKNSQHLEELAKIHKKELKSLCDSHQAQLSTLNQELLELKGYCQQVPFLTEVVVKLEIDLMQQKSAKQDIVRRNVELKALLEKNESSLKAKMKEIDKLQRNNKSLGQEIKKIKSSQNGKVQLFKQQQKAFGQNKQFLIEIKKENESFQKQLKNQQNQIRLADYRFLKLLAEGYNQIDQKYFDQVCKKLGGLLSTRKCIENIEQFFMELKQLKDEEIRLNQSPEEESQSISPSTSSLGSNSGNKRTRQSQKRIQFQSQTYQQLNQEIKIDEIGLLQNTQNLEEAYEKLADSLNDSETLQKKYFQKLNQLKQQYQVQGQRLKSQLEAYETVINGKNQQIVLLKDKINQLIEKNKFFSHSTIPQPVSLTKKVQLLTQKLQSKDLQLNQLSQQLQQSLYLIGLLKSDLEHKDALLYQSDKEKLEFKLSSKSQRIIDQNREEVCEKKIVLNKKKIDFNKDGLLKEYFLKIEEYYNEVLEIFGLQLVSHKLINQQNTSLLRISPQGRRLFVQKNVEKEFILKAPENQYSMRSQETKLTDYEHQGLQGSWQKEQLRCTQVLQESQCVNKNGVEQFHSYLSLNQQQVLRIINQWIRKLERQSQSIYQYKEKNMFLQKRVSQLNQQTTILSQQKMEIYHKYDVLISKLETENDSLEEKSHDMAHKLIEAETYIKQLQQLLHQTNNLSIKNAITLLELQKQYQFQGMMTKSSPIILCSPYQTTTKTYFQQFYESHRPKTQAIISGVKESFEKHQSRPILYEKEIKEISQKPIQKFCVQGIKN